MITPDNNPETGKYQEDYSMLFLLDTGHDLRQVRIVVHHLLASTKNWGGIWEAYRCYDLSRWITMNYT